MKNLISLVVIISILLIIGSCTKYSDSKEIIKEQLKEGVLRIAAMNINEVPITVTSYQCDRSAGGIHDFYSEGDYWWPNELDPEGPYVQRDGQTNPNNFVAHRHAMIRFSEIVANLTSAYTLTKDKKYIEAALSHVRAWFMDSFWYTHP